ncbi:MAG TPA: SdpI family protein [Thermoplasmatales archaeon]|nr:SdpI family protein [Thermoplasmata archaeon]HHF56012.1 SdpI family protein [Thermoplasmatales archaeon]
MNMRKSEIIAIGIILLSFIIGIYLYPQMPEKMASHWNAKGQVDGYISKFWGLFLMPIISLLIFSLFIAIPKIDPLKQNIEKFRKYYDGFVVLMIAYLFYVYLLTLLWNIGIRFSMIQPLVPAMGILFYYIGILVENAKRNWFIGIRTPWTLSSERVWEKTHKIGGKLFKIAGIIAFIGIFFQDYAIFFILIPVISVAFYTIIYSYVEYQKEVK